MFWYWFAIKCTHWWLTFTASCRQHHSADRQASHSLAPPQLRPQTRLAHCRREGSVVPGWEVRGITLFLLMYCSHLRNFVFSHSYMAANIMDIESTTTRHWWLGAWGDRVAEVMAKFGGEKTLPSTIVFHIPIFVLTCIFFGSMNKSRAQHQI